MKLWSALTSEFREFDDRTDLEASPSVRALAGMMLRAFGERAVVEYDSACARRPELMDSGVRALLERAIEEADTRPLWHALVSEHGDYQAKWVARGDRSFDDMSVREVAGFWLINYGDQASSVFAAEVPAGFPNHAVVERLLKQALREEVPS